MPLTAAERSRRYRQKIKDDPNRHREYLNHEKQRYKHRKESGKVKTINSITNERDKRMLRRKWKNDKCKLRKRNKQLSETVAVMHTPPQSPENGPEVHRRRSDISTRRVRKDRAMAYRRIMHLEDKLKKKTQDANKYRQQFYRLKDSQRNIDSPRRKTERMLKGQHVNPGVKKALLLHNVLSKNVKETYKRSKNNITKQTVVKVIKGKILKKYRLLTAAEKSIGISRKILKQRENTQELESDIQHHSKFHQLKRTIYDFYNQDEVSRIKAGKKETVTRHKLKKQKRLLNDTLKNLHLLFLTRHPHLSVSYSLFCRLRPFWVLIPNIEDRETCLCKVHANSQFVADKLFQHGALPNRDLEKMIESTHCDSENKICMYGNCNTCKNKKFPSLAYDPGVQTEWYQWKSKVRENTDGKQYKLTVKEQDFGTLEHLREDFQSKRAKLSKHIFNIRHQYKQLRSLRKNLRENEAVIHIDFSENYSCKYKEEIQSVHFGASHQQTSLHTGVAYLPSNIVSFCTFADSMRHDPPAIWAHLQPVILYLREVNPNLEILHFISDGPTTQYRCRKNFYLFSTMLPKFGINIATWNFLEAGHGKGASDGIGSVIKRTADCLVSKGKKDLLDGRSVYEALSELNMNVKMWWISSDDISSIDNSDVIPDRIPVVPGTMSIHQVMTKAYGEISTRDVSCFCGGADFCDCYEVKQVTMVATKKPQNEIEGQCLDKPEQGISDPENPSSTFDADNLSEEIVGSWCMVKYDGLPYPGIIQCVDEGEVEVKVMHRIGNNRFFWPMMEDTLWYTAVNLITLMPPTMKVTNRHQMVVPEIWERVTRALGL